MAVKEGLQLASDLRIRVIEYFGSDSNNMSHNKLILIEAYRLALGLNYFNILSGVAIV